jgi:hypothetical protein
MKNYQYKIQWLFNVSNSFITPKEQLRKDFFNVLKIIGAKSLTKICFRDREMKIIDTYSSMNQYSYEVATKEAIKYVKKQLKENENIFSIELLRN